jgi:hypothetical protein
MYVSCFIIAFYLVWCIGCIRINNALSLIIYSHLCTEFYYLPNFILFHYFNCWLGTFTPIHIDHLVIRQIREVEDGNFLGRYLSVQKCKTLTYKLILNYAHMYATCSSRGWHATHYIVVLFHFEVSHGFGIFTWNQLRLGH